jgi:spore germination cell wall hydrolase CwlJ-like protein
MKTFVHNVLPKLFARICAIGLIHVLTLGTSFVAISNPLSVSADLEGEAEKTITINADEEILWFARAIYSETKIASEQKLVAWVIRNRVESDKYPNSYRDVVLQSGQFSGFSISDRQYHINTSMTFEDSSPSWDSAVAIAREVYTAPEALRPLSKTVMHFYSPISVSRTPLWAQGRVAEHIVRDNKTEGIRFAFYADIN